MGDILGGSAYLSRALNEPITGKLRGLWYREEDGRSKGSGTGNMYKGEHEHNEGL